MNEPTINLADIPEYREALDKESAIRAGAFDSDRPEFICGIEVLPLTLTHALRLSAIRSPFMVGGFPGPNDVALFLWLVSPEYRTAIKARNLIEPLFPRFSQKLFNKIRARTIAKFRKVSFVESVKAILAFIDEAYMDSPGGDTGGFSVSYFAGPAAAVGMFAKEFGWHPEIVLNMPLKCIFQYFRWLNKSNTSDAILFNPSDKIRRQCVERMARN